MVFFLADDAAERVNMGRRKEFFESTLDEVFRKMKLLGITIDEVVEHYRANGD